MKLTKEQLKQIIKEELEMIMQEEEEGAKTLSPKDARAAIEDGTIKSLEKFYILSPYYDLKADKQYTKKEPAIYVGDGDQVPPETAGNVNVYYKRGGDIVSMRQSAGKSVSRLDQKFRNDPDQPYTKDDLDRMR